MSSRSCGHLKLKYPGALYAKHAKKARQRLRIWSSRLLGCIVYDSGLSKPLKLDIKLTYMCRRRYSWVELLNIRGQR
ncbi:hypothetical protein ACU8KH_00218 [Lachancea thermotolerans]